MPAEFLLATRSRDKAAEIEAVLRTASAAQLITLAELQIATSPAEDDVEQFPTFIENAIAKAQYFARLSGYATIADDSGIMVDALGGAPGVRTKRFASDHGLTHGDTDAANNALLLEKLKDVPDADRGARYVCAAAIGWPNGDSLTAIGTCAGLIARAPKGEGGFGYDPLFLIPDLQVTFAELSAAQKNERSHRALAFRALAAHLR